MNISICWSLVYIYVVTVAAQKIGMWSVVRKMQHGLTVFAKEKKKKYSILK